MTRKELISQLLREWRQLSGMRRLLRNRAGYAPCEGGDLSGVYGLVLHFQQQAATAVLSLPRLQRTVVTHAVCGGHTYEETAALPQLDGRSPLTVLRLAASATETVSKMILLTDEELERLAGILL